MSEAEQVEAGRLLRAARQQSGLSQRALAQGAGVSASVVAHAEAADANPRWALGGQRNHRTDRWHPPWTELGRIATGRALVLGPELSIAIWLPDGLVTGPLVTCVTDSDRWGRPRAPATALDVATGPVATTGTIPVGVTRYAEVLAQPPDGPALHADPATSRALRAVAALLDARERRDRQGRRSAAHKDSRTQREYDCVMARRRFGGLPEPDPRERRDWRLGGEASFREWMLLRRYPLRDDEDAEDGEAV